MFVQFEVTRNRETKPVFVEVEKVCFIEPHPFHKDSIKIGFGFGYCEVDGNMKQVKDKIQKARDSKGKK